MRVQNETENSRIDSKVIAYKTNMFKKYKKAYLALNQLYLCFGENVRALRREKHLSQEELSEMVFTTQKYISCIETGRAHPSLEACLQIADALHVSIDTLLKGIIETGSEVLKLNSPEQDLLDDVIWAVHRYLENR